MHSGIVRCSVTSASLRMIAPIRTASPSASRSSGPSGLASASRTASRWRGSHRPDDDGGDAGVGEQPAQREPGHRDLALRGDLLEPLERVEHPVADERGIAVRALRHPRAGRERDAAAVLAGQPAAGERAVDGVAHLLARAQRQQLLLVTAHQQRVGVLDRVDVSLGERRAQLGGVVVADAGGADQPLRAEVLERVDDGARRDVGVEVVGQVEVDLLDAEAFEARVQLALHPLGRERRGRRRMPSGCRSWSSAAGCARARGIQLPIVVSLRPPP